MVQHSHTCSDLVYVLTKPSTSLQGLGRVWKKKPHAVPESASVSQGGAAGAGEGLLGLGAVQHEC